MYMKNGSTTDGRSQASSKVRSPSDQWARSHCDEDRAVSRRIARSAPSGKSRANQALVIDFDRSRSVTNDAAAVPATRVQQLPRARGTRKVYYRDTPGRVDHLCHAGGRCKALRAGAEAQQSFFARMVEDCETP